METLSIAALSQEGCVAKESLLLVDAITTGREKLHFASTALPMEKDHLATILDNWIQLSHFKPC